MRSLIRCAFPAVLLAAGPAAAGGGPLAFEPGQVWSVRETSTLSLPGLDNGEPRTRVSRSVIRYEVEKVFPSGAALVTKTIESNEAGSTAASLSPAAVPGAGRAQHQLLLPDGRVFAVQGPPAGGTHEEQAMFASMGMDDEVGPLRSAQTATAFLAEHDTSLDTVKVPVEPVKVGAKFERDGFAVTRLKDEAVGKAACAVYAAARGPVKDTTWLDAGRGRVLKRALVQGDPPQITIEQLRLP